MTSVRSDRLRNRQFGETYAQTLDATVRIEVFGEPTPAIDSA